MNINDDDDLRSKKMIMVTIVVLSGPPGSPNGLKAQ
jgi:hypothetical protein